MARLSVGASKMWRKTPALAIELGDRAWQWKLADRFLDLRIF
jgi:hypothetical protein